MRNTAVTSFGKHSDLIQKLKKIAGDGQTSFNICGDVCKFIFDAKDEGEKKEIFKTFLQDIYYYDVNVAESDDSQDDNEYAVAALKKALEKNCTEDEFYSFLWDKFKDETMLSDETERADFLATLWTNTRIPYFKLDESVIVTMENDEYEKMLKKLSDERKKARFILSSDFEQKTQIASLLLSVSDGIDGNREAKAVFWADIISNLRIDMYQSLKLTLRSCGYDLDRILNNSKAQ